MKTKAAALLFAAAAAAVPARAETAETIRGTVVSADAAANTVTIRREVPGGKTESVNVTPSPGAELRGIGSLEDLDAGDEVAVDAARGAGAVRRADSLRVIGGPKVGRSMERAVNAAAAAPPVERWQKEKAELISALEQLPQRFAGRERELERRRDDIDRELGAIDAYAREIRRRADEARGADERRWRAMRGELLDVVSDRRGAAPYWDRRAPATAFPRAAPRRDSEAEARLRAAETRIADARREDALDRQMDDVHRRAWSRLPGDYSFETLNDENGRRY